MFEALGATLPAFAHIPYVAEPGSKLKMSKRKTEEYEKSGILVYLHQYIDRGYIPDALLNYLARLGWSFDGTQEIFTRPELIEKFSLERVNSSAASFSTLSGKLMPSVSISHLKASPPWPQPKHL